MRETGLPCVVVSRDALPELAHPTAKQPPVLVVDLRDQSQIPAALTVLKRNHPTTGVLLVANQLDPSMLLDAMRAGVNEFVTAPLTVSDLLSAIKRLMGSMVASTRGDIIAIVGAKGGVGATTVAVNLATSIGRKNPDSCLLIDLNLACGDAAVFLGAEPRFSVVDALDNVQRLDTAFFSGLIVKTKGGPDLLGAPNRPPTRGYESARIRSLLEFVSQSRQFTVLDVPRSDASALDSLELASKIVIVANQELATVRNANRLAAALKQRYGQARLQLVLARTDRKAEIGLDDVERTVGLEISQMLPSDYRTALDAMNKGRPLVLDSASGLANAFKEFAGQISGLTEGKQEKSRSGSLFGRLTPKKA
jgi:pilus assembly protein CpaE